VAAVFNLIFSALTALHQVAVFMGALFCWGLGVLLAGNAVYWRLHAVPVQGQVVGVRRNGNCLNAVYRYDSPTGESVEATSLEGSSSLRGKETGRQVPLWLIPGKPGQVQERNNHLFSVLGVLFMGLGAVFFWVGATRWRTGPMTWVVGGLVVAHLLMKLRGIVTPGDTTLPPSPWRAMSALLTAPGTPDQAPMQRVEEITAAPEFRDSQSRARARAARFAPLLVLAGIATLAFGVHVSRELLRLEASGLRASGLVTGLSPSRSSNGGVTYYPLVCFTNHEGRVVVFRDSTGSNPPAYHAGEAVTVLYPPPGEPGRALIDRGMWNWLPSAMLFLMGAVFLAVGLAAWRGTPPAAVGPAA
jgi:hypothetical protein